MKKGTLARIRLIIKNYVQNFSAAFRNALKCNDQKQNVKISCNIHRKTPVLESLFNKVYRKETLKQVFPVNIVKFLRTSIRKKTCKRILLHESDCSKTSSFF